MQRLFVYGPMRVRGGPVATWKDVDEVVAALPGTQATTAYGHRAWRVPKRLLVWERPLREADLKALGDNAPGGDIVGLRTVDESEKEELIAAMPGVFFTTPHFDGHAAVLARLEALSVDVLEHLVRAEWRRSAPRRVVKAYDAGEG